MGTLEIRALGGFTVAVDGHDVTRFRSVNVRALLLHLALRRTETLRRDALATLLWPDADERTARQNLRQTIHRLRGIVDPTGDEAPRLEVTRTTARLAPDVAVDLDVAAFRAALAAGELELAVSLYAGDLAPGLDCGSAAFDRWLEAERLALRRSAIDAHGVLGARALDRGDHRTALATADRVLELAPLHEPAHRLRIRALALVGDRAGALERFDRLRHDLDDELGIEPSPETVALATAIREDPATLTVRPRPADDGAAGHAEPVVVPFAGRAAEFARLVEVRSAALGEPGLRVSVVTGPPGIGKTRLVEQYLVLAATEGDDVLRGRATVGGAVTPFQVLVDVLRPRIDRENAPDDLLDDLWLSQLSRLLPELRARYPDLPLPTQDEAVGRGHLHEAVARVGVALAGRRPVTVVLDDLQFADDASTQALGHAVRRWGDAGVPIHLVLTIRSEALATPRIAAWLGDVEQVVPVDRIQLGPFTRDEVAAVASGATVAVTAGRTDGFAVADLVSWLHRSTAGHPLLVTESLKVLARRDGARDELESDADVTDADPETRRDAVVASLRRVVDAWLASLSPQAEQVLTAAAVLGDDATDGLLRSVTGLADDRAAAATVELDRAGLLAAPGDDASVHRVAHDLVTDVVLDRAGVARRRLLHGRALDAMEGAGAPAVRALPHAVAAGRWHAAIVHGLSAGRRALELLAVSVAHDHLASTWELVERHGWPAALGPADRERLLAGLARTLELLDRRAEAEEQYRALAMWARSAGEPGIEARALNELGDLAVFGGRGHEAAVSLLERARSRAEKAGATGEMAAAELGLANAAFLVANDADLAENHARRAGELAAASGDDVVQARHATLSGSLAVIRGDWTAARTAYERGRDIRLLLGDRVLVGDAARSVGYAELMTGDPRAAEQTLLAEQDVSRRMANTWGEVECGWKLGHTLLELGRYGDAVAAVRGAAEQSRAMGDRMMMELAHAAAGHVHRTVFDRDRARAYLAEVARLRDDRREGSSSVFVHDDWAEAELGAMAALDGDWATAAEHAQRRRRLRAGATGLSMAPSLWLLTEALLRTGDEVAARDDVERLRAAVGDNRRYRMVLHRCDAVLAHRDGDTASEVDHLEQALGLARSMGLPGQQWSTLAALAAALRRRGEDERAIAAATEAAEVVGRLAATLEDEDQRDGFLAAGPVVRVVAAAATGR